MKCTHCGRTMAKPWATTLWGPLGPKCGRALGVRPLAKPPTIRVQMSRGKPDPRQRDWVQEVAA